MACALRVCPPRAQPGALRGLTRAKPALHGVHHLSVAASPSSSGGQHEAASCSSSVGSSGGSGTSSIGTGDGADLAGVRVSCCKVTFLPHRCDDSAASAELH